MTTSALGEHRNEELDGEREHQVGTKATQGATKFQPVSTGGTMQESPRDEFGDSTG
jgi:hypothetical protein